MSQFRGPLQNNVVLLPSHGEKFEQVKHVVQQLRVDCVDAILIAVADEISAKCRAGRAVRIATLDSRFFEGVAHETEE